MMESIEKLRKYTLCDKGERLTAYINADEIADEIEAEIAEKYMELPVDADGVPIRIGDTVKCIKIDNYVTTVAEYRPISSNGGWMKPDFYVHVKPRTIEDVLADFASKQHGITTEENDALIAECAAEIRELMEVD